MTIRACHSVLSSCLDINNIRYPRYTLYIYGHTYTRITLFFSLGSAILPFGFARPFDRSNNIHAVALYLSSFVRVLSVFRPCFTCTLASMSTAMSLRRRRRRRRRRVRLLP